MSDPMPRQLARSVAARVRLAQVPRSNPRPEAETSLPPEEWSGLVDHWLGQEGGWTADHLGVLADRLEEAGLVPQAQVLRSPEHFAHNFVEWGHVPSDQDRGRPIVTGRERARHHQNVLNKVRRFWSEGQHDGHPTPTLRAFLHQLPTIDVVSPPKTRKPKLAIQKAAPRRVIRDDDKMIEHGFSVGDKAFRVRARKFSPTNWTIDFRNDTPTAGGTARAHELRGDLGTSAIHVMRTVSDFMDEVIGKHKPKSFDFVAAGTEPSRVKLYNRFAHQFAEKHGYQVDISNTQHVGEPLSTYFFWRPESPPIGTGPQQLARRLMARVRLAKIPRKLAPVLGPVRGPVVGDKTAIDFQNDVDMLHTGANSNRPYHNERRWVELGEELRRAGHPLAKYWNNEDEMARLFHQAHHHRSVYTPRSLYLGTRLDHPNDWKGTLQRMLYGEGEDSPVAADFYSVSRGVGLLLQNPSIIQDYSNGYRYYKGKVRKDKFPLVDDPLARTKHDSRGEDSLRELEGSYGHPSETRDSPNDPSTFHPHTGPAFNLARKVMNRVRLAAAKDSPQHVLTRNPRIPGYQPRLTLEAMIHELVSTADRPHQHKMGLTDIPPKPHETERYLSDFIQELNAHDHPLGKVLQDDDLTAHALHQAFNHPDSYKDGTDGYTVNGNLFPQDWKEQWQDMIYNPDHNSNTTSIGMALHRLVRHPAVSESVLADEQYHRGLRSGAFVALEPSEYDTRGQDSLRDLEGSYGETRGEEEGTADYSETRDDPKDVTTFHPHTSPTFMLSRIRNFLIQLAKRGRNQGVGAKVRSDLEYSSRGFGPGAQEPLGHLPAWVKQNLRPHEAQDLRGLDVKKLHENPPNLPAHISVALAGRTNRDWYKVKQELDRAAVSHLAEPQAYGRLVAMMAGTSPNAGVPGNLRNQLDLQRLRLEGARLKDGKKIRPGTTDPSDIAALHRALYDGEVWYPDDHAQFPGQPLVRKVKGTGKVIDVPGLGKKKDYDRREIHVPGAPNGGWLPAGMGMPLHVPLLRRALTHPGGLEVADLPGRLGVGKGSGLALKADSFLRNFLGDNHASTNDRHEARLWGLSDTDMASPGGYHSVTAGNRYLSRLLSQIAPHTLPQGSPYRDSWDTAGTQAAKWGVSRILADRIRGGMDPVQAALNIRGQDVYSSAGWEPLYTHPEIVSRLHYMAGSGMVPPDYLDQVAKTLAKFRPPPEELAAEVGGQGLIPLAKLVAASVTPKQAELFPFGANAPPVKPPRATRRALIERFKQKTLAQAAGIPE